MYHAGLGIAYSVLGSASDTIGNALALVIHSLYCPRLRLGQ